MISFHEKTGLIIKFFVISTNFRIDIKSLINQNSILLILLSNQISCNLFNYNKKIPNLITVLGHTAGGKTNFSAHLAYMLNTEIISADSRQVYRKMNIGTGKDYDDYLVDGKIINHHLIDIVDPGYEYNVFEYQKDFISIFNSLKTKNLIPILCGGTGLYIEAVLKGYKLINVPINDNLRKSLDNKSIPELQKILASYKDLHNTTDSLIRKRLIRAIEIENYYINNPHQNKEFPEITPLIFGIKYQRETRRKRITDRLKKRLDQGMIEEANQLLKEGISSDKLEYYGLEYKYLSQYLTGKINRDELFEQLNTAIHQFAKRQMTWFRRMEKNGFIIHWIEGEESLEEKLKQAYEIYRKTFGLN
jgi:tRNA dimethylallyltransferase